MEIRHLKRIQESIDELMPLSVTSAAPASIQYQYIGTLVDNTLVLLTGVANSLDGGGRSIWFSDFENWVSAMQAVHRSFYSSLISFIEKGLSDFCEQKKIEVKSGREKTAESIIKTSNVGDKLAKKIKQLAGDRPDFMDYIDVVIVNTIPEREKHWRPFFEALKVVRNKSSHSDPSLSSLEKEKLKKGGLGALVSKSSNLQINTRNYKQIIDCVLQFYKEVGLST